MLRGLFGETHDIKLPNLIFNPQNKHHQMINNDEKIEKGIELSIICRHEKKTKIFECRNPNRFSYEPRLMSCPQKKGIYEEDPRYVPIPIMNQKNNHEYINDATLVDPEELSIVPETFEKIHVKNSNGLLVFYKLGERDGSVIALRNGREYLIPKNLIVK